MTALAAGAASPPPPARQQLPQLVPSQTCLRCDVCCRFPDPDSPLRPYFTEQEVKVAVAGGLSSGSFPAPTGGQVRLVADPTGEGYSCPAFDSGTSRCQIYDHRPLDCRLYPLALMWDRAHEQVVLGWDAKCPFMREAVPAHIEEHSAQVLAELAAPELQAMIGRHPRLVGEFQDDVIELAPVPPLTTTLARRWGTGGLRRFRLEDRPKMMEALERSHALEDQSLAAYSFVYHFMSHSLLSYWWKELAGAFCLFVESPDGWFMPLPPLTDGALEAPLAEAFGWMRRWNGDSPVSRVENLSSAWASKVEALGYRLQSKEGDYLYRASDLAQLPGDPFKSQRALCNRAERIEGLTLSAYRLQDRAACRMLLTEWRQQKEAGVKDPFAQYLLTDAAAVHEVLWTHAEDLNVAGMVVRIQGRIRGYTLGTWLTARTWCVLLEVTDRTIPGLAQYLFRETCRTAVRQGAAFVNTMDDAGLPGLRQSKQAYHPLRMIESFLAVEDRR